MNVGLAWRFQFFHHQRGGTQIRQVGFAFVESENLPLKIANRRRCGPIKCRQLTLLVRGSFVCRDAKDFLRLGRQWPEHRRIFLTRYGKAEPADGVAVAVIGIKTEVEFGAGIEGER